METAARRRSILAFLQLVQQYCTSPSAAGYQAVLAAAQELALRGAPPPFAASQIGTDALKASQYATPLHADDSR